MKWRSICNGHHIHTYIHTHKRIILYHLILMYIQIRVKSILRNKIRTITTHYHHHYHHHHHNRWMTNFIRTTSTKRMRNQKLILNPKKKPFLNIMDNKSSFSLFLSTCLHSFSFILGCLFGFASITWNDCMRSWNVCVCLYVLYIQLLSLFRNSFVVHFLTEFQLILDSWKTDDHHRYIHRIG